MNVVGNRHVGNNVRILLINNGKGNEFRNYYHPCSFLGDEADKYVAAAGHFGNKSSCLVRDYANDLGYEYLTAKNKQEFNDVVSVFLQKGITTKPLLFEVFTETQNESDALKMVLTAMVDANVALKKKVKKAIETVIGETGLNTIRKVLNK